MINRSLKKEQNRKEGSTPKREGAGRKARAEADNKLPRRNDASRPTKDPVKQVLMIAGKREKERSSSTVSAFRIIKRNAIVLTNHKINPLRLSLQFPQGNIHMSCYIN